jgi:hypothetical protein
VRHLPAWYAQKHPDEDFAETFAVWLNPHSNWREVYADWNCLNKLLYVDELVKRIGSQPPPVTANDYDPQEEEYLGTTIAEFYRRSTPTRIQLPRVFDAALRDIFPPSARESNSGKPSAEQPAAEFLRHHRRAVVGAVFYWTGLNHDLVQALEDHLEDRCAAMGLQVGADWPAKLIEVVAFITTLCMTRLHTGEFVQK